MYSGNCSIVCYSPKNRINHTKIGVPQRTRSHLQFSRKKWNVKLVMLFLELATSVLTPKTRHCMYAKRSTGFGCISQTTEILNLQRESEITTGKSKQLSYAAKICKCHHCTEYHHLYKNSTMQNKKLVSSVVSIAHNFLFK